MKSPSVLNPFCLPALAVASGLAIAAPFGATIFGKSDYLQFCDEHIDQISATAIIDAPSRILLTI